MCMPGWYTYNYGSSHCLGGDCWKSDYKGRLDTVGEKLGYSSKNRYIRTYAKFGCSTFIVFRRWGERPNERVITAGSYWQVLLAGLVAI